MLPEVWFGDGWSTHTQSTIVGMQQLLPLEKDLFDFLMYPFVLSLDHTNRLSFSFRTNRVSTNKQWFKNKMSYFAKSSFLCLYCGYNFQTRWINFFGIVCLLIHKSNDPLITNNSLRMFPLLILQRFSYLQSKQVYFVIIGDISVTPDGKTFLSSGLFSLIMYNLQYIIYNT